MGVGTEKTKDHRNELRWSFVMAENDLTQSELSAVRGDGCLYTFLPIR